MAVKFLLGLLCLVLTFLVSAEGARLSFSGNANVKRQFTGKLARPKMFSAKKPNYRVTGASRSFGGRAQTMVTSAPFRQQFPSNGRNSFMKRRQQSMVTDAPFVTLQQQAIPMTTPRPPQQRQRNQNRWNLNSRRNQNNTPGNKNTIPRRQTNVQRNRNMAPRNKNIASRNQNMASRNQNMAPRNRNIASRNQNMASRNQNMAPRNQNIAPRNKNIASRNQNIASRNQNIATRHQNIASRNQNIAPRNQNSARRNQNIASRNQNSARRNQNNARNNQMSSSFGPMIKQQPQQINPNPVRPRTDNRKVHQKPSASTFRPQLRQFIQPFQFIKESITTPTPPVSVMRKFSPSAYSFGPGKESPPYKFDTSPLGHPHQNQIINKNQMQRNMQQRAPSARSLMSDPLVRATPPPPPHPQMRQSQGMAREVRPKKKVFIRQPPRKKPMNMLANNIRFSQHLGVGGLRKLRRGGPRRRQNRQNKHPGNRLNMPQQNGGKWRNKPNQGGNRMMNQAGPRPQPQPVMTTSAPFIPPGFGPQPQFPPPQPPRHQQSFPPQAARPPQGFPPQAAPPNQGFPPQAAPPNQGFPPQAVPPHQGFPPQVAPPQQGFPHQAAPQHRGPQFHNARRQTMPPPLAYRPTPAPAQSVPPPAPFRRPANPTTIVTHPPPTTPTTIATAATTVPIDGIGLPCQHTAECSAGCCYDKGGMMLDTDTYGPNSPKNGLVVGTCQMRQPGLGETCDDLCSCKKGFECYRRYKPNYKQGEMMAQNPQYEPPSPPSKPKRSCVRNAVSLSERWAFWKCYFDTACSGPLLR